MLYERCCHIKSQQQKAAEFGTAIVKTTVSKVV